MDRYRNVKLERKERKGFTRGAWKRHVNIHR